MPGLNPWVRSGGPGECSTHTHPPAGSRPGLTTPARVPATFPPSGIGCPGLLLSPQRGRYSRLVPERLRGGLGHVGDGHQPRAGPAREPAGEDVAALLPEGVQPLPAADTQVLRAPRREVSALKSCAGAGGLQGSAVGGSAAAGSGSTSASESGFGNRGAPAGQILSQKKDRKVSSFLKKGSMPGGAPGPAGVGKGAAAGLGDPDGEKLAARRDGERWSLAGAGWAGESRSRGPRPLPAVLTSAQGGPPAPATRRPLLSSTSRVSRRQHWYPDRSEPRASGPGSVPGRRQGGAWKRVSRNLRLGGALGRGLGGWGRGGWGLVGCRRRRREVPVGKETSGS